MLFIIILIALAISGSIINHFAKDFSFWDYFSGVLSCVATFVLVICCIVCAVDYANIEGTIAANEEIYNSLVYQVENGLYEDDIVGKKALMDQVQDWNKDLARGNAMKDNIWVGVFYPDKLFEHFDYIPIDSVK